MSCTSGFMNDVTFGRSGRVNVHVLSFVRYSPRRGVATLGRSLVSMNALLLLYLILMEIFQVPAYGGSYNIYM